MIYGLLITLFVVTCALLMGLILIQKSKGSLGLGNIGGSMQMLFGGSGGQDFLQKATWILGGFFMLFCFGLAVYKTKLPRTNALTSILKQKDTATTPAKESNLPAEQPTKE